MRGSDSTILPLNLEFERSTRALHKVKIKTMLVEQQHKEEIEMADPSRQTFSD